jgi:hypothetical protein
VNAARNGAFRIKVGAVTQEVKVPAIAVHVESSNTQEYKILMGAFRILTLKN